MKFTDIFGNIHVRDVNSPDIASRFFKESNCVDTYNQGRRFELKLKKKWFTDNTHFRLAAIMYAIDTTDTWKLAAHHRLLSYRQGKNNALLSFAGILSKQLFTLGKILESRQSISFSKSNTASIPDMSNNSMVSLTKKRKFQFKEWMTEEPVKVYFEKNNKPHPLCQFSVKVD